MRDFEAQKPLTRLNEQKLAAVYTVEGIDERA
jgi:hypothetical protein